MFKDGSPARVSCTKKILAHLFSFSSTESPAEEVLIFTMLPLTTTTLLLASLGLASGLAVDKRLPHDAEDYCKKKCPPSKTCLVPKAVQTGSLYTGLEEGTPGIRPGLSESDTYGSRCPFPLP